MSLIACGSLSVCPTFDAPPGDLPVFREEVRVVLGAAPTPLVGDVVLVVDGLDGAHQFARTVHALVGVDVQHACALVDAVDGAFLDACLVFDVDTGFGDGDRH